MRLYSSYTNLEVGFNEISVKLNSVIILCCSNFNEIVKQCAKELDIPAFTIPSLSGVEWNRIKDLSNKAKDPADLMNEVKVMFHL